MATYTSNTYDGRYLQLSITESVNVASNKSTLSWTLTSAGGASAYYTIDATTVTINGTQVYYKARTYWEDRVFPAAKGSVSGTLEVPHNSSHRFLQCNQHYRQRLQNHRQLVCDSGYLAIQHQRRKQLYAVFYNSRHQRQRYTFLSFTEHQLLGQSPSAKENQPSVRRIGCHIGKDAGRRNHK